MTWQDHIRQAYSHCYVKIALSLPTCILALVARTFANGQGIGIVPTIPGGAAKRCQETTGQERRTRQLWAEPAPSPSPSAQREDHPATWSTMKVRNRPVRNQGVRCQGCQQSSRSCILSFAGLWCRSSTQSDNTMMCRQAAPTQALGADPCPNNTGANDWLIVCRAGAHVVDQARRDTAAGWSGEHYLPGLFAKSLAMTMSSTADISQFAGCNLNLKRSGKSSSRGMPLWRRSSGTSWFFLPKISTEFPVLVLPPRCP